MEKGYLQISFAWLFAFLAGAFIIFLAIYASKAFIQNSDEVQDTKTSKEIGILLNPLETGFETGKTTSINMPSETRIQNRCDIFGTFGKQLISTSKKSFGKWTKTDRLVDFENKYIFSEDIVEGEKFYIFSKPFYFPFKVSDLIYLTSSKERYCFKDTPDRIENEIKSLNQKNIILNNCSETDIKVCFSLNINGKCDINVDYNSKIVKKNNKIMHFEYDSLMYAAVFSSPEIYECQLKRLMKRTEQLALIYNDKAALISYKVGCNSNLNLLALKNLANNLESSANLNSVNLIVEDIQEKNKVANCKLW